MISIIIPTLNEEKVIADILDALKSGLTIPHELIVSDGKSTDKTVEIARKHADTVVTYSGEARQTIAMGRNAGADAAKGEFLLFLDADCILQNPDHLLTTALENFKDPRTVAVTAWLNVIPENATFLDNLIFNFQNVMVFVVDNILHGGTAPGGEFQLIRTDVFRRLGGFRGALVASEDIDMFNRLSKAGRVRMDHRVKVYHSGRRGHKEGWPKLLFLWVMNTMWMKFSGKAFVKEWKPIR